MFQFSSIPLFRAPILLPFIFLYHSMAMLPLKNSLSLNITNLVGQMNEAMSIPHESPGLTLNCETFTSTVWTSHFSLELSREMYGWHWNIYLSSKESPWLPLCSIWYSTGMKIQNRSFKLMLSSAEKEIVFLFGYKGPCSPAGLQEPE